MSLIRSWVAQWAWVSQLAGLASICCLSAYTSHRRIACRATQPGWLCPPSRAAERELRPNASEPTNLVRARAPSNACEAAYAPRNDVKRAILETSSAQIKIDNARSRSLNRGNESRIFLSSRFFHIETLIFNLCAGTIRGEVDGIRCFD